MSWPRVAFFMLAAAYMLALVPPAGWLAFGLAYWLLDLILSVFE